MLQDQDGSASWLALIAVYLELALIAVYVS